MNSGKSVYEPMWMDVNKISGLEIYPIEVRDWLGEDIKDGFRQTPREVKLSYPD